MDSNKAGKDSNRSFMEVPASTWPFNCSTPHSTFLATTVEAIASFKFDRDESYTFLRRESALLSMTSLSTPYPQKQGQCILRPEKRQHQYLAFCSRPKICPPQRGTFFWGAWKKNRPLSGSFHCLTVSVSTLWTGKTLCLASYVLIAVPFPLESQGWYKLPLGDHQLLLRTICNERP